MRYACAVSETSLEQLGIFCLDESPLLVLKVKLMNSLVASLMILASKDNQTCLSPTARHHSLVLVHLFWLLCLQLLRNATGSSNWLLLDLLPLSRDQIETKKFFAECIAFSAAKQIQCILEVA